jgi:hypothetical protein
MDCDGLCRFRPAGWHFLRWGCRAQLARFPSTALIGRGRNAANCVRINPVTGVLSRKGLAWRVLSVHDNATKR